MICTTCGGIGCIKCIQSGIALPMVARVVKWNGLRYEQEFNKHLQVNLLVEETREFIDATEPVDELDALIDIIYISIGAMWKLGLNIAEIEKAIQIVCDSNDSKSVKKTASHIKANTTKGINFIPPEPRLQEILDGLSKKNT